MNGDRIAFDTNRVIAILNGEATAAAIIGELIGIELPVPVVAELRFGALNSNRSEQNLERVERIIERTTVVDITNATASVYARLRLGLRKKGRPIPENDLWIAAVCIEHSLQLWTDDAHFAAIDGLVLFRPQIT